MTIAGTVFDYPLTPGQLQNYLDDPESISFNVIDTDENKPIGHAELVYSGNNMYKIDKLLIGDKSIRGKGTGQKIIDELLKYSFENLKADIV